MKGNERVPQEPERAPGAPAHDERPGTIHGRPETAPDFAEGTKRRRPAEHDVRIDLTADDAVGRLDEIADAVEDRRKKRPGETLEDASAVTEDDERELAETLEESDAMRREDAVEDPAYWLDRQCRDAAQLFAHYAAAGYDAAEVRRLVDLTAERLAKELDDVNALRARGGRKPYARDARRIKDDLMNAYGPLKPPASSEATRQIEPAPQEAEDDDITKRTL